MAAGEHASLPRELRWMRRVIDHPVPHAVVYTCCVGLSMLHAGLALGILGRRAGGAEGARLAHAGNSAACVGICTLLFSPVALYLFGLRAAVAAMESDELDFGCKGARQERGVSLKSLVLSSFDSSVISIAFIHLFVVCPRWIHEWRTGQKSCGLSTVLLSAQGGSMSGE